MLLNCPINKQLKETPQCGTRHSVACKTVSIEPEAATVYTDGNRVERATIGHNRTPYTASLYRAEVQTCRGMPVRLCSGVGSLVMRNAVGCSQTPQYIQCQHTLKHSSTDDTTCQQVHSLEGPQVSNVYKFYGIKTVQLVVCHRQLLALMHTYIHTYINRAAMNSRRTQPYVRMYVRVFNTVPRHNKQLQRVVVCTCVIGWTNIRMCI